MTFATAHAAADDDVEGIRARVPPEGTVVLYMGLGRLEATCAALVAAGRPPSTPAAVVSHATLPDQRTAVGTLADVAAIARRDGLEAPALLIVGDVVAHRVRSGAACADAVDTPEMLAKARRLA